MPLAKYLSEENSNEDSFLDVVANVVGVLIILIMLVGAQASQSVWKDRSATDSSVESPERTTRTAAQDLDTLRDELKQSTETAIRTQREVRGLSLQVLQISQEAQAYDQQRVELAMHRSMMEEDLQRRKEQLDEQDQHEYEVQRKLLESKIDLETLTQEQFRLISAPGTVEKIECVPTPLARVIEGKAIHLRLSQGLVSVVPFEKLMEEVQINIAGTLRRVNERGRTVETYGPLDGYRLQLTMARRLSLNATGGPLVGKTERVQVHWVAEILPVSAELGQNVEQSLLPGGVLHQYLLNNKRQRQDVVVWLYTDSFDAFRPLKRALWEMGFSMATRPMRPGSNIRASPEGTRAAVQ